MNIIEETLSNQDVVVCALTGGPVAGKSSLEIPIMELALCLNYDMIWIDETATQLINSGLKPVNGMTSPLEFQRILFEYQRFKEDQYIHMERETNRKLIIVCDRGLLDAKAYMNDKEWSQLLSMVGTSDVEILSRYLFVIHMVTAAEGAEEAFEANRAGNKARSKDETKDVAIALDHKIREAYLGHRNVFYVSNETDFEGKKEKALRIFLSCIGKKELSEHQEKYIVEIPSITYFFEKKAQKRHIVQTYLKPYGNEERRLRMLGDGKNFVYYLSRKEIGSNTGIQEKRIGRDMYDTLMMEMDPSKKPIIKDRWYFSDHNVYYNLDVYPNWKKHAILEIRSSQEDVITQLPQDIKMVKNVTEDTRFQNYRLSEYFPLEEEIATL